MEICQMPGLAYMKSVMGWQIHKSNKKFSDLNQFCKFTNLAYKI